MSRQELNLRHEVNMHRMTLSGWVASAVLLSGANALGDTPSELVNQQVENIMQVPDTAAAFVLGIDGERVARPATYHEAAAQISSLFQQSGDFEGGGAVEFAPFALFNDAFNGTKGDAQKAGRESYGWRFARDIRLSLASSKSESDVTGEAVPKFAIGLRMNFLNTVTPFAADALEGASGEDDKLKAPGSAGDPGDWTGGHVLDVTSVVVLDREEEAGFDQMRFWLAYEARIPSSKRRLTGTVGATTDLTYDDSKAWDFRFGIRGSVETAKVVWDIGTYLKREGTTTGDDEAILSGGITTSFAFNAGSKGDESIVLRPGFTWSRDEDGVDTVQITTGLGFGYTRRFE